MKTKYLAGALAALGLFLTSCSEPATEAALETTSETTATSTVEETSETNSLTDISNGVAGEVGKMHGLYCDDVNDCRVQFIVEELAQLDRCDDYLMEEQPEGTNLMKATVRLITKPAEDESYDPGEFPVWTDWSALTEDGINQPLPSSISCYNDTTQRWDDLIQAGDTEMRIHYMDVPQGTKAIRLTETLSNARWEFDLATQLNKSSEPSGAPAQQEPPAPAQSPVEQTPVQEAPTPVEQPAAPVQQAPAEAPVRGFTGAPGSPIVDIDKTISHCGDPMLYETGTTFFTDGTTAWTETCSAQMLG